MKFLPLLFVLSLLPLSAAAQESDVEPAPEPPAATVPADDDLTVAQIKAEIHRLEASNARLEQEVAKLEGEIEHTRKRIVELGASVEE